MKEKICLNLKQTHKTVLPVLLHIFFTIFFNLSAFAQTQSAVFMDETLERLTEKFREYRQKIDVEEGYRIQITYTTNREEAYKAKARLYKEFENTNSYIEYEQPNYKLRMGDFKTRLEATAFLQQVIKLYPGAFIVKDRVKTR